MPLSTAARFSLTETASFAVAAADWQKSGSGDDNELPARPTAARLDVHADCIAVHFTEPIDHLHAGAPDRMPLRWGFAVLQSPTTLLLANPSTDQGFVLTADQAVIRTIEQTVALRADGSAASDGVAYWAHVSTTADHSSLLTTGTGSGEWRSRLVRIGDNHVAVYDDAESTVPILTLTLDKATTVTPTAPCSIAVETAARGQLIHIQASHRHLLAITAVIEHRVHAMSQQVNASVGTPAKAPRATTSKLSDAIKRQVAGPTACRHFCGGKACKYEHHARWGREGAAITGVYSNWYVWIAASC